MVDTAFDDFLDSDDDAFFLEASNHFLDCDLTADSAQLSEKNYSQKQSNNITSPYLNLYNSGVSQKIKNDTDTEEICTKEGENDIKNVITETKISSQSNTNPALPSSQISLNEYVSASKSSLDSDINNVSNCNNISSENINSIINESRISQECNLITVVSTPGISSKECVKGSLKDNTSIICGSSSFINNRFTPGFTPKAKKRKFPGPAGLLEMYNGKKEIEACSSQNISAMDMEFENIVSSQFTPEHLSLSSWQNLQSAVSSCPNLLSTVKYYSIQRVLQEASKKKLPKHMIAPVLCVLLKNFNYKGSTTISVFMDDTGEIKGRIDPEVMSTYKDHLVEGTALILKTVTFLCNVLILKVQNLVSIFHPDGTEKHPQSLDSILKTSDPLKPMKCECLNFSHHSVKNSHKIPHYNNTADNHRSSCMSHTISVTNQIKTTPKIPHYNNSPVNHKSQCVNSSQIRFNNVTIQNNTTSENVTNLTLKNSPTNEASGLKNMRSDAFLENLLDEDNCMDEFDELLGNLDEKSFMEDM